MNVGSTAPGLVPVCASMMFVRHQGGGGVFLAKVDRAEGRRTIAGFARRSGNGMQFGVTDVSQSCLWRGPCEHQHRSSKDCG